MAVDLVRSIVDGKVRVIGDAAPVMESGGSRKACINICNLLVWKKYPYLHDSPLEFFFQEQSYSSLRSGPSGIILPGTELLQSPFRTECSMGSRSRRYRRSLRRHRRFLRSYCRFLRSYRRSLQRCPDP